MKTKASSFSFVALIVPVAFVATVAFAEPSPSPRPKSGPAEVPRKAPDKSNHLVADQAKRMMANDKRLHDSVVAAIKAKDAAKVHAVFARQGLNLPPIRFATKPCCAMLPPFALDAHGNPTGTMICCD